MKALYSGAFLFLSLLASTITVADETATVRHVLDGDTFILVDGRHVRLIGVNAPELGKDDVPGQPLAKQARNRLSELVKGQRVTLSYEHERQDHYGRWLAHARLPDGGNVEEILLREGLVWAIAIPPNVNQLDSLIKAENEACAAARGVWGEPAYRPKPAENLTLSDTGFQFIEGTIQRRARGKHVIYFDLTPRVALVVPREDWQKYFAGKSTNLVGRTVVARGWLTEKRDRDVTVAEPRTPSKDRLHLRVPHPAMLTWRD